MIDNYRLTRFVLESNRIEGIAGASVNEIEAHKTFLAAPVSIETLVALVGVLQPDARLRDREGVPNVRVGQHVAPLSGIWIRERLNDVLRISEPYKQHVEYETLHPFTDGNGRSGRALWLYRFYHQHTEPWADRYAIKRGFLHSWYYHSLSSQRD